MTVTSVSGAQPGHALARSLLDCAGPADSAARQAIDDALRQRSADPVLHAAALWLAFSSGGDPRLSRSRVRGWVLGLRELIDSGHLDAAAYALPGLKGSFPQVPYLDYMALVFEHLPPAVGDGRGPFADDRNSDVQIALTPGADTVIVAFTGATHQLGISVNIWDRWFAQLNSHVVYLRDRRKVGYVGGIPVLGSDMKSTIEGLSRLVGDIGARRVVCVGNSAGATGALRYARRLGAERVLALAPITGGRKYAKLVAPDGPTGGVVPWGNLVPLYRRGRGVRAHILYGEKNAGDRQQSERMAGLPGVTVEALPDWESHHLVAGLIRSGRLGQVLGWLVFGDEVEDLNGPMSPSR
jgi:hypothetical protein